MRPGRTARARCCKRWSGRGAIRAIGCSTRGFFVCGFHVAFIATHLPSFLTDGGLPRMIGATALSLIGLCNIFGSSLFGWLGDRYRKKYLLSALYFSRAVVIGLVSLRPPDQLFRPCSSAA